MTRQDMYNLIDYYLRDSSVKGALEDTDVKCSRQEIVEFLDLAADCLNDQVGLGYFDE